MTNSVISNSLDPCGGSRDLIRPSLSIRSVADQDLLKVAQLLCESFYPPSSQWRWALPVLRVGIYQDLRTRLVTQSPKHSCFVAVMACPRHGQQTGQEKIVGTVEVALRSLWLVRRPVPYLSNLAVAPNYRRQGVAQNLLLACEQVAITWKADFLYLNVLKTNSAAQRLYAKVGYCPELKSPWPRFGRSKRLLLRKHLSKRADQ